MLEKVRKMIIPFIWIGSYSELRLILHTSLVEIHSGVSV